jgi:hypothetical protein
MLDFPHQRPDPEVERQISAVFEAEGLRFAPAESGDIGTELIPGLPWEPIVLRRGSGGGPGAITPDEIRILLVVFMGAFVAALGTKAGNDAYEALRRAFKRLMGSVINRATLYVVNVDRDREVEYELPADPDDAQRALAGIEAHLRDWGTSGEKWQRPACVWDKAEGRWVPRPERRP